MRSQHSFILGVLLTMIGTAAEAQVYKCEDAQGRTTYQQQPCVGGTAKAKALEMRPADRQSPPPPAAAAAGSPNAATKGAAKSSNAYDASMAERMVTKERCDHLRPGFAQKTDADYLRWRERDAQAIAALEANPDYQKWRRLTLRLDQPRHPLQVERECDGNALIFAKLGGLPDPQRATPELAWNAFGTAVSAGDREALLKYSMGMISYAIENEFESRLPTLREYVRDAAPLEIESTNEHGAGAGIVRHRDGTRLRVSLVRLGPNWHIAVIERTT